MKSAKRKPQEELFPFVEMEKLIPENHMLRLIDRHIDFSFIDELVDHTYSETTGRPATDPELMVRILTIGYLYNLSEIRLFEELRMHAAYRWFCNFGFYDSIPDRSTLNRLRNHRWAQDGIFEKIMQNIVKQCISAGMVSGKHVAVDGTQIRANASIKSLEPIIVESTVEEYLQRLNLNTAPEQNFDNDNQSGDKDFRGDQLSNQTHCSTTDPDARLYKKAKGQSASLSYVGNDLIDTKSRVILATDVTQPGVTTEIDGAHNMLDSLDIMGILPMVKTLAADKGFGTTEFITDLINQGIVPHIPLLAKSDVEPEPIWKTKTNIPERQAKRDEKVNQVRARNQVRQLAQTNDYKCSQNQRKRIEHIFAEAKVCHGLGRARCRGLSAMREQLSMTAAVQNMKRLVSFLRRTQKAIGSACVTALSGPYQTLRFLLALFFPLKLQGFLRNP